MPRQYYFVFFRDSASFPVMWEAQGFTTRQDAEEERAGYEGTYTKTKPVKQCLYSEADAFMIAELTRLNGK